MQHAKLPNHDIFADYNPTNSASLAVLRLSADCNVRPNSSSATNFNRTAQVAERADRYPVSKRYISFENRGRVDVRGIGNLLHGPPFGVGYLRGNLRRKRITRFDHTGDFRVG
jgi:hypothetical protein